MSTTTDRDRYAVHVTRADRHWHVHVPGVARATQARRVGEIDDMARDLIAIMRQVEPDSFDLDVHVELPPSVTAHLEQARRLRDDESHARAAAAAEVRAAARELHTTGVPLRDLGPLLGVSHQRAHQLVAGDATRS